MITNSFDGSLFNFAQPGSLLFNGLKPETINGENENRDQGLLRRNASYKNSLLQEDEYISSVDSNSEPKTRIKTESGNSFELDQNVFYHRPTKQAEDEAVEKAEKKNLKNNADNPTARHKVDVDLSKFVEKQHNGFAPNGFESTQESNSVGKMIEEMMHETEKRMLQGVITRTLKNNGVELDRNDCLQFTLNGKGELDIDVDASSIDGFDGDELESLCREISSDLNAETVDDKSFGDVLLKHLSKDMGFDYDKVKGDESFCISFTFRPDSATGENRIVDAEILRQATPSKKTSQESSGLKMQENKKKDENSLFEETDENLFQL